MVRIVAWLTVCLSVWQAGALAQPNIVLILSDDAGYNEIGYTGSNEFRTPNIDAIAQSGVVFTNAYVTQPICGPSRAGLLTGRYQQRLGFEENVPHRINADEGLRQGQATIATRLRDLGYSTGIIGKWHLGSKDGVNRPLDLGFDEFFGTLAGSRHYWGGEVDDWKRIRRQNVEVEDIWPTEGDQSRYDPVRGRYLTDAFGEEAADFINRHANDPEPFFLFVSFTAPHEPYEAKNADLAQFPNLTGDAKTRAAMTLAMDRAVGDIQSALADNNLEQSTIIVFLNDNGGAEGQDNRPFTGYKGQAWEGGIRVPMCIRWPGMPQGELYDRPVISMDLVPTLVAAAGGRADDTDGADLAPFLTGQQGGDPHESIFVRDRWEWAVRRGPWKLVRPESASRSIYLFNLDDDPGETENLSYSQGPLVQAMRRDLAAWEATLDKPRWTESGALQLNQFDHFRSREPSGYFNWSNPNAWYRENSQEIVTFLQLDAYANAVLEFPTRSSAFVAKNVLGRMTDELFMLRQLRFTNSSGQGGPFSGRIIGDPLVMVTGLTGEPPSISLESLTTPFAFRVENQINFLGNLTLEGDGTSPLTIAAPVTEYLPGQSATKAGHCNIDLESPLQCTDDIVIEDGTLTVRGPDGRLDTQGLVDVRPPGLLRLESGADATATTLRNAGRLEGEGLLKVHADFAAEPGSTLAISLGGKAAGAGYDQLTVSQTASLGGRLTVRLRDRFYPAPGDEFRIVQSAQASGAFADFDPPPDLPRRDYTLDYDATGVTLRAGCATDLNDDGHTDSRDFLAYLGLWSAGDPLADWNHNDAVDSVDFIAYLNEWVACAS